MMKSSLVMKKEKRKTKREKDLQFNKKQHI